MIVPGSKKAVLGGPLGNFEVLNGPVLQIFLGPVLKDLRSVGTLQSVARPLKTYFCYIPCTIHDNMSKNAFVLQDI